MRADETRDGPPELDIRPPESLGEQLVEAGLRGRRGRKEAVHR